MHKSIQHFDALTKRGLQVIPLWANTKIPRMDGWTNMVWDRQQMRDLFCRYPSSNLGLLLGNIIDVEGDSPQANEIVSQMIGDYPHPSYVSTKSVHHLFLSPDPKLRRFVFQDIEFRGFGHQSVLPRANWRTARSTSGGPTSSSPFRLCRNAS